MNPFFLLTLAVAVSILIIPLGVRFAPRLGMVDMPDARKVHHIPVPRVGGWGITMGSLIPLLLAFKLDPMLQSLAVAIVILFVYGVWDDARQINHWVKFSGQVLAAGVVVYYGHLYVARLPFIDGELNPAFGKPFTMFALIGMINAINHSDGLDGLAGGESMLSLIAIAILGYLAHDTVLVGIALATIGGILGFLRYNSYPARVFMGDSGSQVLGLTLGFLAVYLTQKVNTAMSAALPLLLFGMPISDILSVLFRRIRAGMNWFKATRNHVHHRLLDLCFDHYETVVIIYSVHAVLVVCALLMRYDSDAVVALTYLVAIGSLFGALTIADRAGWRVHRRPGSSSFAALMTRMKANRRLRAAPLILISALIPAFMLLDSLWVTTIPRDFAVVAGLLAAVIAIQMLLNRAVGSLLVRAAIYVTAVFSAYLMIHYPGIGKLPVENVSMVAVGVLALAIGAYIRFNADKNFGTTPTDYLIVFGLLALTVLSSIDISARAIVDLVIFATVLLYGCEVVIGRIVRGSHILHFSTLATLVIMAVRGAL